MYWVILLLRYVTYFDYSVSNKSMGLGTFLVLGPWVTMAAANDKITLILDECCFSSIYFECLFGLCYRDINYLPVLFLSQFLKAYVSTLSLWSKVMSF